MPLEVLALLVPAGIALIVLLVRFWGLSKAVRINDSAQARQLLLLDYPDQEPERVIIITNDHRAAFLRLEKSNALGLVEVMGDRYLTRVLSGGDIGNFETLDAHRIKIRYHDFTHPWAAYAFSNAQDLALVIKWINEIKESV